MWSEDILCSIAAYLPHDPSLLTAFAAMGPRATDVINSTPSIPRCAVSLCGGRMAVLPLEYWAEDAARTPDDEDSARSSSSSIHLSMRAKCGSPGKDTRLSTGSPMFPKTRLVHVDGHGRIGGQETAHASPGTGGSRELCFSRFIEDARAVEKATGVVTRVESVRLEHCRRLMVEAIPSAFASQLCVNSLRTIVIDGSVRKATDTFLLNLVMASGPTIEVIELGGIANLACGVEEGIGTADFCGGPAAERAGREAQAQSSVSVSPATIAQIESRCVSLRRLAVPTSSSFLACAVAKLLLSHPSLEAIEWQGNYLNVLPAVARHCRRLVRFTPYPPLLWRARDTLALVRLVITNNNATLRELSVDCGAAGSETGRYVASIMTMPSESSRADADASLGSCSEIGSDEASWSPTPLAARLVRLVFQEGFGIPAGQSALAYFSRCANLSVLDLSVDTLASLHSLPHCARLERFSVTTISAAAPQKDAWQEGIDRLATFLLRQRTTLESVALAGYAACPSLLLECCAEMPRLRRLRMGEKSGDDFSTLCVSVSAGLSRGLSDEDIRRFAASVGGRMLEDLALFGMGGSGGGTPSTSNLPSVAAHASHSSSTQPLGAVLTDASVGYLVAHCRALRRLAIVGPGVALTDEALGALYDHPDPTVGPLFSLTALAFAGPACEFSFAAAAGAVRRVGGALRELRLGTIMAPNMADNSGVRVGEEGQEEAPESPPTPIPFIRLPRIRSSEAIVKGMARAEHDDAAGVALLLSACGRHCPHLRTVSLRGVRPLCPDAASLSEFKQGCRLGSYTYEVNPHPVAA